MSRRFNLALLPWLSFAFVDRNYGMGPRWAALSALATVAVVALVSRSRPRLAGLDAVAVVVFGAAAAGASLVPAADGAYSRAATIGVLGLSLALSGLGRPLTTPYVRENRPPTQWSDPRVARLARALALRWGGVGLLTSVSLAVGAALGGRGASTVFNWLIPLLAVIVGAVTSPGGPDAAGEKDRQTLAIFDGLVGAGPVPAGGSRQSHLRSVSDSDVEAPRRAG